MVTQPGKEQEATILAQSQMTLKMLGGVQSVLRHVFSRQEEEAKTPEGSPTPVNVLDEVINNQNEAHKQIENIHEFIVQRVIKKIA